MALTQKQKRFTEEYLVDLNGTQAAVRAGYSAKTAKDQASRMLTKADINQEIQTGLRSVSERTGVTVDGIVSALVQTYEMAMAEKDFSSCTKILELLGKHVGMWPKPALGIFTGEQQPQVVVYLPDNGRGPTS
jgi:phage terminase small subunit